MEKLGPGDPLGVPPGVEHGGSIGAYRLLARLGAGGMGQVYLARSERGRMVAVKLVREELAAQEEFRERFRQEVQAARRVGGYWTAPVLDADTEAAVPWVATGYVAGPSLQQVVGHDHGALPERTVRILAAGLAHALKDIHTAGIVHRDLKPSNVLVTIDGPRVIDFGIARALETVTDGGLTRTGALVGSPGFMAPEQVRGDRITPACDVFCLGSVLAYAATGALPFGTANSGVHALMFRIAQEEPDLEGVPEGIADLVRDCLRKDPAARPSLDRVLARTGADDTVADGRALDPWLPSALVAQLGRHAVRLLDAEDPEGAGSAEEAGAPEPPAGRQGSGPDENPGPTPEHAPAADESAPRPALPPAPAAAPAATPAPPPPGRPGEGPPVNHLPTMVAGQGAPPAPRQLPAAVAPPHPQPQTPQPHPQPQTPQPHPQPQTPQPPYPAYGYPQQHPQPHPAYGGLGSTPPYGPPPYGTTPPYGPPQPQQPRGNGRSTALLVVIALVVALAAGGSVYALMQGGGPDRAGDGAGPTQGTSAPPTTPGPSPTTSQPDASASPADGTIPAGYLGTWTTTIDNADGEHSRSLTIQQGEPGDTILSLVADGPTKGGGTYHCVFEGRLTAAPGTGGALAIGPSTVKVGQPRTACTPGAATEVTLLSDGTLERVNTSSGERLTYTKQ
ncbi:serine/threonine-protein kinase [Streptomyces sp. AK010]|uniref:serine/threonine-protein kinase n=1 Tax=Streptomyces sp. AK010 TaxID=2723074 RepID=UPI00160A9B57|nr:serine/threonine-protein kinase [Streptomyces sp. AK010]MBB6418501.1 serine/threonine protein kinase [Streptomyces sp. AK010]